MSPNGNPYNNMYNNPNCMGPVGDTGGFGTGMGCSNREIIPQIPESVSTNQQVLYALAKGTGGFEIFNTNDFLQGLTKVAKEMNEYYDIGYAPPGELHDGSYHRIKVEVKRSGVKIRYRTGYFDIKDPDLLKGTTEGKSLEARAESQETGEIPVSLRTPYFFTEPGVARVNVALSIPGSAVEFEKQKGGFHSTINVLGIAYRQDGSVAARFSDAVKLEYEKKQVKELDKGSFPYQNTFNIAPGSFTLKLVLSAGGEKFGKYVAPLVVEPFTGTNIAVGGLALGEKFVPVTQLVASMDADLLEDRTPMVFKDMELVPSTTGRFDKGTEAVAYVEVYDPQLKGNDTPFNIGILYNIVDLKSNQTVYSSNTLLINDYIQKGNPLVPLGFKVPTEKLQAGDYRFDVKARDELGGVSNVRSANFSIQ